MAQPLRPDLCIVGAGALGIALAQYARQLGASVVLVDRGDSEPGDSAESALRLAILQASAARAQALRDGSTFGLSDSHPKISFKAIQDRMRRLVKERAPLDSAQRLAALGITVLQGQPRFANPTVLTVDDTQVGASTTILAVGPTSIVPAISGLDGIDSLTIDSILQTARKLSHLLVIGDDASAYALAQAFSRLGSDVTLVPQGYALQGFDSETAAILLGALAQEGVRVLDGGVVSAIHPRSQGIGAVVDMPSGTPQSLDVSHILVAMGGTVDLALLDPATARLRPSQPAGQFATGDLGQTSNRRIRVVGAAAGMIQWQHALRHGRAVVEAVVLGAPRHKVAPQPQLVLTVPPLAQIGRVSASADKGRGGTSLLRASMAESAQALALGEAQGLVKVEASAAGAILGASLVGPGAVEMAAMLSLGMERGLTLGDLTDLSLPHPSLVSTISALADNHMTTQPVSAWTARRRALRRIVPFGG